MCVEFNLIAKFAREKVVKNCFMDEMMYVIHLHMLCKIMKLTKNTIAEMISISATTLIMFWISAKSLVSAKSRLES